MPDLYLGAIPAGGRSSLEGGAAYYADTLIVPHLDPREKLLGGVAIQGDHKAPLFEGANALHPVFNSKYLGRPVIHGTEITVGAELTPADNLADRELHLTLSLPGRTIGTPIYPQAGASEAEQAEFRRVLDAGLGDEPAFHSLRLQLDAPSSPNRRGTLYGVGPEPGQYTVVPFTQDGTLLMVVAVMNAFRLIPDIS